MRRQPMQPQPQRPAQAQQQAARQAEASPERQRRGGLLLPLAGLGAAAMVLSAWMAISSASAEVLTGADLARAEADWQRLQRDGLTRQVMVRDWADVDGDAVRVNGVLIPATTKPTAITLPPGGIVMHPVAGNAGCVTLEIVSPGVEAYRLCLPPGRDLPPITVR